MAAGALARRISKWVAGWKHVHSRWGKCRPARRFDQIGRNADEWNFSMRIRYVLFAMPVPVLGRVSSSRRFTVAELFATNRPVVS
jgi:hypothetical protein